VINLGEVIDGQAVDGPAELVERLALETEGERNNTLFRVAREMFRLVANGELDRAKAVEMLRDASERNGFIEDDGLAQFERTVASAERTVRRT
jgi:hypothetical protein